MKTATINVTTKNGHSIDFTATESKTKSGYGNDTYVCIENSHGELFAHIDARYVIGYNFESFLRDEFSCYYGDNLDALTVTVKEVAE